MYHQNEMFIGILFTASVNKYKLIKYKLITLSPKPRCKHFHSTMANSVVVRALDLSLIGCQFDSGHSIAVAYVNSAFQIPACVLGTSDIPVT